MLDLYTFRDAMSLRMPKLNTVYEVGDLGTNPAIIYNNAVRFKTDWEDLSPMRHFTLSNINNTFGWFLR